MADAIFAEHLGDGAYVRLARTGEIEIYTNNGIEDTNVVVLDRFALTNLEEWIEKLRGEAQLWEGKPR
jgi:hypothetical protein